MVNSVATYNLDGVNSVTTYNLDKDENSKIVISHDELKALFHQIEADFCQSDTYNKAFNGLHKRLGSAPKGLHSLMQAIGREAIRLTLRQVVCQYQNTGPNNQTTPATDVLPEAIHSQPAVDAASHPTSQSEADIANPLENPYPEGADPLGGLVMSSHVMTPQPEIENPGIKHPCFSQDAATPAKNSTPQSKLRPLYSTYGIASQLEIAPAVQEGLRTIGTILKEARLDKELSIRQLHERTHVGMKQITAIEEGNLVRLPEEIYIRGFIRQLARALDLDYETLTKSIPQPSTVSRPLPLKNTGLKPQTPMSLETMSVQPAHLYIGYAALMASAVGGLVWVTQAQKSPNFGGFDFSIDIPDMIDDINSILPFEKNTQQPSYASTIHPGAIAYPEVMPVESSMSGR